MKKKLPFFLAALIIYAAVAIMSGGPVEEITLMLKQ